MISVNISGVLLTYEEAVIVARNLRRAFVPMDEQEEISKIVEKLEANSQTPKNEK